MPSRIGLVNLAGISPLKPAEWHEEQVPPSLRRYRMTVSLLFPANMSMVHTSTVQPPSSTLRTSFSVWSQRVGM
jgi:hypothetical protein